MDTLPFILLGTCIRTALKEDISATIVYGTTFRLLDEFFSPSPTNSLPDPSAFINQLFRNLQPIPTRSTNRNSHIPNGLAS